MNPVEIEEAISALAEQPFDPVEFPFAFLQAFGNKDTTIKKLRSGASNKSDLGGVFQTNNIHILVCPQGETTTSLSALKASPATAKSKARFILATDGEYLEAEDLTSGENCCLRLPAIPGPFRHLSPAGRDHNRQTSQRKRLRHQGHRSAEQTLCRIVKRQS
jgi:hypothetical protein